MIFFHEPICEIQLVLAINVTSRKDTDEEFIMYLKSGKKNYG